MSETPSRRPRHVPFWLVLSLMVNMMLVGLVAGMVLRPPPRGPEHDGVRFEHRDARWEARKGERAQIASIMRLAYDASKAQRDERVAARKALGDALGKDPYDADAVRAAFAQLRAADESVHAAIHEQMTEQFAGLPVDERVRIGELLERGPGGFAPDGMPQGRERVLIRRERLEGPDDGPPPGPDMIGPDN